MGTSQARGSPPRPGTPVLSQVMGVTTARLGLPGLPILLDTKASRSQPTTSDWSTNFPASNPLAAITRRIRTAQPKMALRDSREVVVMKIAAWACPALGCVRVLRANSVSPVPSRSSSDLPQFPPGITQGHPGRQGPSGRVEVPPWNGRPPAWEWVNTEEPSRPMESARGLNAR